MAKEELISGLKNAVENGASLEQAKLSFINAGYNPQEVEQAAREASSGVLQTRQLPKPEISQYPEEKEKKSFLQKIPLIRKLFKKKQPAAPVQEPKRPESERKSPIPSLPSQPARPSQPYQPTRPTQPTYPSLLEQQLLQQKKHKDKTKTIAIIFSIVLVLLLILLFLTIYFRKWIISLF